nr:MAG TPA: hypothetical protein [Caudoviricetes sp.]
MTETINCVYETPCGWCSKWDKKCDKKTPERGQRVKCHPIDDAFANKMRQSEFDHEWVYIGISTVGTEYICRKCFARKNIMYELGAEDIPTLTTITAKQAACVNYSVNIKNDGEKKVDR